MTVFVDKSSKSVLSGISKMKAAMIEDYKSMSFLDSMVKEYVENFTITYGKKYIKITEKGKGVTTDFAFDLAYPQWCQWWCFCVYRWC